MYDLHVFECMILLRPLKVLPFNFRVFLWFSLFKHGKWGGGGRMGKDGYSISAQEKEVQNQVREILSKGQVELFMRLLKRINKK